MQLLKEFGIIDEKKSVDFCREAYKFLTEGEQNDTPSAAPAVSSEEAIAVDMGLPSGTLWADRNIGAKSPEDFGLYFSWGNIEGHVMGSGYDFDDYNETKGHELDGDIDIEHDAARFNMGEPWQMPTKEPESPFSFPLLATDSVRASFLSVRAATIGRRRGTLPMTRTTCTSVVRAWTRSIATIGATGSRCGLFRIATRNKP